MAAEFLASHGVDLHALLQQFQLEGQQDEKPSTTPISKIINARLPKSRELWDINISNSHISSVEQHTPGLSITHIPSILDAKGGLVTPSFCHSHIHLDKCFLLSDEKYSDLEIVKGDFAEAMALTGQAKQRFEEDDLLRRGGRLVRESIEAGVTSMRAFVEVDEVVGLKCLRAGLKLKEEFAESCEVQICAFAQLALFSGEDGGEKRRALLQEAVSIDGVGVIGSTPYVEDDEEKMKQNVEWTIGQALSANKHLDFHLDYNIDPSTSPLVWFVLEQLKKQGWTTTARPYQKICLGHCTRLTLFSQAEWHKLHDEIYDLPVSFVGLPTSDLFMMGRPKHATEGGGQRPRATMQIPNMIQKYGLNGSISINNVGNAFTPHGSCDPLALASLAVGVYQAGTKDDTELIFECISSRAAEAIGSSHASLHLASLLPLPLLPASESSSGENENKDAPGTLARLAELVVFNDCLNAPKTISDLVYTGGAKGKRRIIHRGRLVCG